MVICGRWRLAGQLLSENSRLIGNHLAQYETFPEPDPKTKPSHHEHSRRHLNVKSAGVFVNRAILGMALRLLRAAASVGTTVADLTMGFAFRVILLAARCWHARVSLDDSVIDGVLGSPATLNDKGTLFPEIQL